MHKPIQYISMDVHKESTRS